LLNGLRGHLDEVDSALRRYEPGLNDAPGDDAPPI